ncbi:GTP cyclohydrolase N terminal [Ceratobasidium sp. AG-Ba]|nr:GTP cyclohydrolase N terminal [Ceratobasidium sp. AG-Ba]
MPDDAVLSLILSKLDSLAAAQTALTERVESMSRSGNGTPIPGQSNRPASPTVVLPNSLSSMSLGTSPPMSSSPSMSGVATMMSTSALTSALTGTRPTGSSIEQPKDKALYPNRVIMTTYPDQTGIKPTPLTWAAESAAARGPVRTLGFLLDLPRTRDRDGHTLAFSPTQLPPYRASGRDSSAKKLVYATEIASGLDVRPSIAITKAHIKLSEIDAALVTPTALPIDGKIVIKSRPLLNPDGTQSTADPGVELACSKAAVEPVWWLPGVAERFGIHCFAGRLFLPPIGGLTVYIFGNPAHMRDSSKELTLRVHDECNGSDVFGSDICTCKPYLVFAIEECVRTAQRGGVGIVVYFRKEGRALGEVTKYLVYNLRKRGGDSADKYFKSTEMIAGVKDMRFQALMPDILHWLGITKIDNMISMSDMKYNAIVDSGIPIVKRYDLPEHLIPPDSRVEIDAKIAAGYFTSGKQVTEADLYKTVGRTWEETDH